MCLICYFRDAPGPGVGGMMWAGERSQLDFLLGLLEASQGRGELSRRSSILGPAQRRSGPG